MIPHLRNIAVFLALLLTPMLGYGQTGAMQQLTVSPDGPITSLGEAVRQAPARAHIRVSPGHYCPDSTIVIDKPLTIEGTDYPIIDGQGAMEIIRVEADSVTIRGLELRDVGTSFVEDRAAIKVREATGGLIEGNRIIDGFFGIYLAKSSGVAVRSNLLRARSTRETTSGNGIHLWYCKEISVEDNLVDGHRDGIYFEFVEDSQITGNESRRNLRYGLHFMFSDRCRYEDNLFEENDAGVAVMYTEHVEMLNNRFVHNWGSASYGLLLKDITDSRIAGNTFVRNSIGLYSENSNRVRVEENEFTQNGWAIKIMSNSMDNEFTRNNFVGNTFDVATNSRQNYSSFDENYWDNYEGYDLDRDGYGDVPFRPVRLFSLIVERNEPALILLHSILVDLLDTAERLLPILTPETLADQSPRMKPYS